MDEAKTHEVRCRVAAQAAQDGQKNYQAVVARCRALSDQLSTTQDNLNRALTDIKSQMRDAEREREGLRVELEVTSQLSAQLEGERLRHQKSLELQSLGGAPAPFEVTEDEKVKSEARSKVKVA
jgi:DnaJ-domain-containing protein 1